MIETKHCLPSDLLNHSIHVENLYCAFSWTEAPMGYTFWDSQHRDGALSDLGRWIWAAMGSLKLAGKEEFIFTHDEMSGEVNIHLIYQGVKNERPTLTYMSKGIKTPEGASTEYKGQRYVVFKNYPEQMIARVIEVQGGYIGIMQQTLHSSAISKDSALYYTDTVPEGFHFEETKRNFGTFDDCVEHMDGGFVKDPVTRLLNQAGVECTSLEWNLINSVYQARFSSKTGFIALYKTAKDRARDRLTSMKVGKAIRWMCQNLSDSEVERVVKKYNEVYEERDFTLHIGKERQDFAKAYGKRLTTSRDPRTTISRKSLHNSCMRGILVGEGISPAEVYASGDFHIAWLEDSEGKIAGRVVVYDNEGGEPQAGPVYGVCEHSLNKLEEYLESINAVKECDHSSWEGAKVLRLTAYGNIVGPYSDMETNLEFDGEYLVFDSEGPIGFHSTSGLASGKGCICAECGEAHTPDEVTYASDVGDVCNHCIEYNYVFCEGSGEYIHESNAVEVYTRLLGTTETVYIHENSDNIIYCECVEEFWHQVDVTYSEHKGEYVPTHLITEFPEYFPEDNEQEGEAA